ncbi:MAG: hypothetical protein U0Q22_02570 [Acidimicrobiales bacterium]
MSPTAHPSTARRLLLAVVPLVLAVVFLATGDRQRAAVTGAVAVALVAAIALGVPVERWLGRGVGAILHVVGLVFSTLVGLALVAVGAVLRLGGFDPLTPSSLQGNQWHRSVDTEESDRLSDAPFGVERSDLESPRRKARRDGRRGPVRSLVLAVGTVAALVLADAGVGVAWRALADRDATSLDASPSVNLSGRVVTVHDPRADLPAMAGASWADAYFREVQLTPSSYWPFTETRPGSFSGKYVNVVGWERRSYRPVGVGSGSPVVWMFGGSALWGEGQRDGFTIASYVARRAEASGLPVVVRNFGQRGWTHFQEMLLFEQLLASEPLPDVVVFYDGGNEVNAQSLSVKGVPTHVLVDQYAALISGGIPDDASDATPDDDTPWSIAWKAYTDASAIRRGVKWLRATLAGDAGASGLDRADTPSSSPRPLYTPTSQDASNAVKVYRRGRSLSQYLARRAGVAPLFVWQPLRGTAADAEAAGEIDAPTVNLSNALAGHEDVFIDSMDTNEDGARLVADRLWDEIARRLRG